MSNVVVTAKLGRVECSIIPNDHDGVRVDIQWDDLVVSAYEEDPKAGAEAASRALEIFEWNLRNVSVSARVALRALGFDVDDTPLSGDGEGEQSERDE
jgi:hypothetical protein